MISFFRRALSSWLVLGLLGLIMVAFIITGISDPGMMSGLSGSGGSVAKVGGEKISAAELRQRVQMQFDNARRENPGLDIATFIKAGGVEQTVDQLIAARALEVWARKQGMGVSERLVDGEIASVQAFAGPTGKFDDTVYRAALAQRGLTEQMLRDDIAGDLLRRQLLVPIAAAASAPLSLVTPYASLLLEARTGLIGIVPAEAVPAGAAPTAAEIEAFYRQNIAGYTLPERRVIRFATFGAEKVSAAPPTDAEIAAFYKANAADYGSKEARSLSQVVLPDEAAARAFAAKVKAGTPFAAAAQQAGFAASDIALGEKSREELTEIASAAVAAAAFALPQGGVTAPAKSDFGWHVVRVDAVRAVAGRPLAAVRNEIAASLARQKSDEALANLVAAIDESVADGATFDDVVKAEKLTAVTTPALLADGRAPDQPNWAPPAELAVLLKTGFEMAVDDDPTVETIGNGQRFALLDVAQVIPSAPEPLARIRAQVEQDLRQKRAFDRAKSVAAAIVQKAKSGTPLAQAFSQAGMPLPAPERVSGRQIDLQQQGREVPPPLRMLFAMKQGDTRLVAAPGDRGWFVVNLQTIVKGDAAKAPDLVAASRQQFGPILSQEYIEQFLGAIRKELGVTTDKGAIESLKAELRGGAAGR